MRLFYVVVGLIAATYLFFSTAALAQDPVGIDTATGALQVILQQGVTGAIAVLCLIGFVLKDRQITRERDAWADKLLALSMQHAAETAKTTAMMNSISAHMDRIVRYLERNGT